MTSTRPVAGWRTAAGPARAGRGRRNRSPPGASPAPPGRCRWRRAPALPPRIAPQGAPARAARPAPAGGAAPASGGRGRQGMKVLAGPAISSTGRASPAIPASPGPGRGASARPPGDSSGPSAAGPGVDEQQAVAGAAAVVPAVEAVPRPPRAAARRGRGPSAPGWRGRAPQPAQALRMEALRQALRPSGQAHAMPASGGAGTGREAGQRCGGAGAS